MPAAPHGPTSRIHHEADQKPVKQAAGEQIRHNELSKQPEAQYKAKTSSKEPTPRHKMTVKTGIKISIYDQQINTEIKAVRSVRNVRLLDLFRLNVKYVH